MEHMMEVGKGKEGREEWREEGREGEMKKGRMEGEKVKRGKGERKPVPVKCNISVITLA